VREVRVIRLSTLHSPGRSWSAGEVALVPEGEARELLAVGLVALAPGENLAPYEAAALQVPETPEDTLAPSLRSKGEA
jgi:hypothetical protein